VTAGILAWCDAAGRSTQGVWRLNTLCDRLESGGIKSPCNVAVVHRAAGCIAVDGDDGGGHYVCDRAVAAGIEVAEKNGVAAVAIFNSNFCGALSYYSWRAAEAGFVSLLWSNAFAKVASHGGTKAVFGTNPMAFGAPYPTGEHFLVDFSTSASAGSTVRLAAELGQSVSSDVVQARSGQGESDTQSASDPLILPFGGAKGFSLALICELLCSVLGSAAFSVEVGSMYANAAEPGKNGQFMILIDPARFLARESYAARIEQLVEILTTDNGDTRIPGSARHQALGNSEQFGIELTPSALAQAERASRRYRVELPGRAVGE
jgi:LDH2 family malate/lactate/ureidoglycolate dehydrogenase